MLTIKKIDAALGATVENLDLTAPLQETDIAELKWALAEYQVLFFRDQDISYRNHQEFGIAFGSLQRHPSYPAIDEFPEIMILENDRENPSKIDEWHTDMSFKAMPPLGSILIGRVVPDNRGDTMFSNLAAAYEDLPGSLKRSLEGMTATHSFAYGFKESIAEPGGRERLKDAINNNPDVVHPVIRTHPVTGRKLIFLNRLFTRKIDGLSERKSNDLLNSLCDHMVQDKYVYRFNWRKNSIAFWDNRSVLHVPVNDYWPTLRRMERVTINDTLAPA
jgi:taurine dioxygenase